MALRQPDPQSFLPLMPAAFHILMALADEEKHGYAIMREIAASTENKIRLGPATLYSSIRRLVENGLIIESSHRGHSEADDQRRRYYRLTELGRRVAEAEATRMAELVRTARSKNLLQRPRPA